VVLTLHSTLFLQRCHLLILGQLIDLRGTRYSPLSARLYLVIFANFDLISIIIQAIGSATASKASSVDPHKYREGHTRDDGRYYHPANLHVCLCHICPLGNLASSFCPARIEDNLLLFATSFSKACIIIRNFYYAIELS
jgi:hypothetical protein